MSNQRKGGTITFSVGGVLQDAAGDFSYNLGRPLRETLVGVDRVHGYTEKAQPAFIEGEITDRGSLDLAALVDTTDTSVTLTLANLKCIVLRNAWFAGEGTGETGAGKIGVRFEGLSAEEVT